MIDISSTTICLILAACLLLVLLVWRFRQPALSSRVAAPAALDALPAPSSSQQQQRVLCIVNPVSGQMRGASEAGAVSATLRARGMRLDTVVTKQRGHAAELLLPLAHETTMPSWSRAAMAFCTR
jgi:hypothetical protein